MTNTLLRLRRAIAALHRCTKHGTWSDERGVCEACEVEARREQSAQARFNELMERLPSGWDS